MLIIRNATAVELSPPMVATGWDIVCEDGLIREAGPGVGDIRGADGHPREDTEVIDAAGALVMPGLVNSHTHIYSTLARGTTAALGAMPDFPAILERLWWRLDRSLTLPAIESSAAIYALEAIRCGTTTLIDHHASAGAVRGSLRTVAGELARAGLRSILCYETSDRDGEHIRNEGLAENADWAAAVGSARTDGEQTRGATQAAVIGAHALFTLSDGTLGRLAELCSRSGCGLHIHLGEDPVDRAPLTARLEEHGLLGPRTIVGHGIHVTDEDLRRLVDSGTWLAHNPRSNMNNGVGYNHRLPELHDWSLGTDGIGSDLFTELRVAYFRHRDSGGPLGPQDFVDALAAGNRLAARHLGGHMGRIAPGYAADLITLAYNPPTPLSAESLAGHMVFGIDATQVRDVIAGGSVLMRDGSLTGFSTEDLADCYRTAREQAAALWQRMEATGPA